MLDDRYEFASLVGVGKDLVVRMVFKFFTRGFAQFTPLKTCAQNHIYLARPPMSDGSYLCQQKHKGHIIREGADSIQWMAGAVHTTVL